MVSDLRLMIGSSGFLEMSILHFRKVLNQVGNGANMQAVAIVVVVKTSEAKMIYIFQNVMYVIAWKSFL